MRPMASATNRPTVRPEPQPYVGKETAAPEKTPIQADYEALKRFSYRDISDRPSVYEEPGTGRARPPKEGDTSKGSDGRPDFSTNKDAVVVYASNLLNLTTARENKEACCNLYSVMIDGKRHYFTGEIFVGEMDNVIAPYLSDVQWEKLATALQGAINFQLVQYEGFMHSHPYYSKSNEYSGGTGDSLVALLSGDIYLTTPDGHIFDLTREQALFGGLFTDPGSMNLTQFLTGGLIDPPEVPYHDLHSIDTTQTATYNTLVHHDIPGAIRQALLNNRDNLSELLGFDIEEAARQLGIDIVELLSQLNLYT